MDQDEASALIADVDQRDHEGRTERLVQLTALLPDDGMIGFSGQAAQWLFEDVKATWLYGCFTSTVVTAQAFCAQQLAGSIRMLPDDSSLRANPGTLEQLAAIAADRSIIDVDLRALLVELNDRSLSYTATDLHEYEARLERHLAEAEALSEDHPLLVDARQAVTTAIRLVYRRP